MTDKLQNGELEIQILGCVMLENDAQREAVARLTPEDFYTPHLRKIFESVLALNKRGIQADIVTLYESGVAEASALSAMLSQVSLTSGNIFWGIEKLKSMSTARRLLRELGNYSDAITNGEISPELIEKYNKIIRETTEGINREIDEMDFGELVAEGLNDALDGKPRLPGVKIGIPSFDGITYGLMQDDFIVIAGRPGTGKTALMLQAAMYSTRHDGKKCAVVSIEMGQKQLCDRGIASGAEIEHTAVRTGRIGSTEMQKLVKWSETLTGWQKDMRFYLSGHETTDSIYAKIEKQKSKMGCDIAFIDYLQLIEGDKSKSRFDQVSQISRDLKAFAKDLKIPIVALAQLNRKATERKFGRPCKEDLGESGHIEQDASIIGLLWRPSEYGAKPTDTVVFQGRDIATNDMTCLIIDKNRNAPKIDIWCDFDGRKQKFTEIVFEDESRHPFVDNKTKAAGGNNDN
jgi:replicative DNA helicase